MTVGVGHRSLEAAASEKDFATVLKEADGAMVANQNFHDVEPRMTRAPDLADPSARDPSQGPLFPSIHRPIPFPALLGMTCLNFNKDQHLAFQDHEVELITSVPPVARQAPAAVASIIALGVTFAPSPKIGRGTPPHPPRPQGFPNIVPKHVR
jgi:hypothetical protein